jgi:hypothetical protein
MLHGTSTKIISELKNYFSSDEKIFQTLFTELRSLRISGKMFRSVDKIYPTNIVANQHCPRTVICKLLVWLTLSESLECYILNPISCH